MHELLPKQEETIRGIPALVKLSWIFSPGNRMKSRIKIVDRYLHCKYFIHIEGRDGKKAAMNKQKHGVAFEEAQTVFDDCDALRIFDPDHSEDEDRFLLLGLSSVLRLLVVCHCYRENDEQIRIISARKATKKESATYERRK